MPNLFKWFTKDSGIENVSPQENSKEEKVSLHENTEAIIEEFSKLVEQGNQAAVNRFIKFMANAVQGELISKCFYNDRNYGNFKNHIVGSFLLDLPLGESTKCNERFKIADTPIISCIWNYTRTFNALQTIGTCNNNPFDVDANIRNIHSLLINPLGLVIVKGGNHSTNSAIVHNEGDIIAKESVDISTVLERYKFNGKDYINIDTNEKIDSPLLKNNSEPFVYTLGLLFEMARVLKEKQNR